MAPPLDPPNSPPPDRAPRRMRSGSLAGWVRPDTRHEAESREGAAEGFDGESSASPMPPPSSRKGAFPAGSRIADRYTIVRFLASGGMGEVYAAHDDLLDVDVALK